MADTVRLVGPRQRAHAHALIEQAPDGWVMKLGEETRRDAQNRLMWPLLKQIQTEVEGMEGFSTEEIKLRFLNQLGVELRLLPCLEGQGFFPVGLKSSTLTVEQFSGLLDLIYEWGARHGIKWEDRRAA